MRKDVMVAGIVCLFMGITVNLLFDWVLQGYYQIIGSSAGTYLSWIGVVVVVIGSLLRGPPRGSLYDF